jgi:hypothetical protein
MCFVNSFVSVSTVSLRIGVLYHSDFFSLLLLLIRSITTNRTIACSAGLPCFCFTRNFVSFFLPGVAQTAVSCLLLVCDVILASSVPGASFCFFFFIASSAGYLFAIHRSALHPDDTLETRKGDKRWKRNTHNRRSIQISVQSVRIIIGILSLRL